MIGQLTLMSLPLIQKDIVYTPNDIACDIVTWLKPKGLCLDPCYGDGNFYRHLPENAEWCELQKGKDFFDYNKKVDWIVGNPPYSIFEEWLHHSFEIADEVAYILPTNKVFQRQIIMEMINKFGGIKQLRVYGSGSTVGFPFGFSVGTFHFSRNYKGKTNLILGAKSA